MLQEKKAHQKEKTSLHIRNKHRGRYNFKQLINTLPELKRFVHLNKYDDESINFFNPEAVKTLNKALLKHYYNIDHWNIPTNYLSPPIPGRADYIHHIADLLADANNNKIPKGHKIKCIDIGVGASCIYPIIGNIEYGWSFIASDIDILAIESSKKIIKHNLSLIDNIELRFQNNKLDIFYGIIKKDELIDITICNPPFHSSKAEAEAGTMRKLRNLKHKKTTEKVLNFGGKNNELWCKGGERKFVRDMIRQSKQFSRSCLWFTTLISKQDNLASAYEALKKANTKEYKTIEMKQGNKTSRIIAWTFHNKTEQQLWMKNKFSNK